MFCFTWQAYTVHGHDGNWHGQEHLKARCLLKGSSLSSLYIPIQIWIPKASYLGGQHIILQLEKVSVECLVLFSI